MSDLQFTIKGKSINATKFAGETRQFLHTIDEPAALGGADDGANPVEFILAGYAGCLNVVTNLIAKELNIPISNLKINVTGNLNPAKFLGLDDTERAGFKNLEATIEVDSPASEEQIALLLKTVEERCPVNDNLSNPTPISVSIKNNQPELV
jgi:uncharacterized OsmC-like protein